jgi:4-hydroxy-3-polyprenylbenzoate decarboxylase
VYPATIVGIPPMEDFYIGAASVKLFLPIFQMNFPEIVDISLPAEGTFHNLVVVSIRKTYPMQAYKIMHGLWGMGQMMFSKYIIVVDAEVNVHDTREVLFHLFADTDPQRDTLLTRGPSDVLDHATSHIGVGDTIVLGGTCHAKLRLEGVIRYPEISVDGQVLTRAGRILLDD